MGESEFSTLLEVLQRGEVSSRLLEEYGHVIRAAVRRKLHARLRTQFDSLDFVQDVWASVLALPADRRQFNSPAALVAFLGRIANNKVTDAFRRRFRSQKQAITREQAISAGPGDDGSHLRGTDPTPSLVAMAAERWEGLLAQLPPGHQPVLEQLRAGYTLEQIAAATGVSLSTVNRVVRRLKSLTTGMEQ